MRPGRVVGADQPRHGGQQHGQLHRPRLFPGTSTGTDILYFTSKQARPCPGLLDIYASERGADGPDWAPTFGTLCACGSEDVAVHRNDARPAIRADGLEAVLQSDRLPWAGLGDVWDVDP